MTTTIERAQSNLRGDERRTGGAASHAASAAGEFAERAVGSPAESKHAAVAEDAIGRHLPPLPRSTGRAMARGRRRLRTSDRRMPTFVAALTVTALVVVVVALVITSAQRRRSPAERFVQQLERVPSRIPMLDG